MVETSSTAASIDRIADLILLKSSSPYLISDSDWSHYKYMVRLAKSIIRLEVSLNPSINGKYRYTHFI